MAINTDMSAGLAIDASSLNQLKLGAAQSSPEALKAAAQQFEAVFMNMLMKSMRDATPKEGMFDNDQTRMYTSMLDQQLSQRLASRGIGLADVMVRQLSRGTELSGADAAAPAALNAPGVPFDMKPAPGMQPPAAADSPAEAAPRQIPAAVQAYANNAPAQPASALAPAAPARKGDAPAHVESFVQRLLPHAQAASTSSGIPAHFMMGQAALETGWGRAEIRGADGQNSHNLFGIKAGGSWTGRTVDIVTTEYVNGKPQKQVDTFRAYDSYADSFRDYAKLLSGNARYQNVLAAGHNAAGFAQGLQQAGYATDPKYAQKLMSVIRLVETG
ncbi:MAG TPA: flagellar assembly peptidoglycan hydrolase FlgJ [Thiobacillus sp.]|nr:MAG: flagellar rod assembly protein/muramidase FlgJ [Hydrogenophilales bacterium 28-61-11]OZA42609.1 MAG: flagellar rod assembly protein/muramidase FlgJ [Hydrogenophilales bacterium 17-61-76]HQT31281.1 flagellar assembly peptidoglycan hydrolase FlgJ [Thiobacillus sp.]HQT69856.1 flagellar assembly peptidoglycan hydrolase FlgJ [Thiobacillus sp.]